MRASKQMQLELQKQIEFADRISKTLSLFFREDQNLDIAMIKINSPEELDVIIAELSKY